MLLRLVSVVRSSLRTCSTRYTCGLERLTRLGDDKIPHALYGGRHIVTMLPGDGIGPELMTYVEDVLKLINAPIDFEKVDIHDGPNLEENLRTAIFSIKRNGCAIKGTIEPDLDNPNFKNPNVEIRNNLDLYVNLTYCKSLPIIKSRHKDIDIFIIRQNTEGEYAMLEHEGKKGVVESLKIITYKNTKRIAKWAFEFAKCNNRKKLTIVHKANIMKLSDGLFLKTVKEVGKKYPDIICNDIIVDNCSMQIISDPHRFDIMIMPNLYGVIVTNLLCGIIGGAGVTAGANYGRNYAVFEPACRTLGTSIAGQNKANPVAMLSAAVSLMYHLKRDSHGKLLNDAIKKTLYKDRVYTSDIGGKYSSTQFIDKVKENIMQNMMTK